MGKLTKKKRREILEKTPSVSKEKAKERYEASGETAADRIMRLMGVGDYSRPRSQWVNPKPTQTPKKKRKRSKRRR
jgi:hypothetical protein